ncbi:MAG TPA: DUF5666 domain-containing protein, partial [Thermoanaerobaculia bacterium]|nr:DUF5666 domain-containing protein [Thermoanaerobaculia bacterium]
MNRINRLALYLTSFAIVATAPGVSAFAGMSTLNGTLLGLVRPQNLVSRAPRITTLEGTVESIKSDGVVIRTKSGDIRLYATNGTPVNYRGDRYSFTDLEQGDVVRVSVRSRGTRDYDARSFDVLRNVSASASSDNVVDVRPGKSYLTGQVVKIKDNIGAFRLETDNGRTVTVNASGTNDFRRGQNWLYDLHSGDQVRVNGSFSDADVFKATSMQLLSRGELDRDTQIRAQEKRHGDDGRDRDRKKSKDD